MLSNTWFFRLYNICRMHYTYLKLTQTIFPNGGMVVIDKFHLNNTLDRTLNQTRSRADNEKVCPPSSREFKALKRYWKLLLVPHEQLNFEHFHKWSYFPYWITAKNVITRLLKLDPILKQTYTVLNRVQTALQHKNLPNYNAAFWHVLRKCLGHLKYHRRIIMQFITLSWRAVLKWSLGGRK